MPDIIYNRPIGHKKYISIAKHQVNANNSHSKWMSVNIEKDMFDYADYGNYMKLSNVNLSWSCSNDNLWSILEDRTSVGKTNEQFGFFQKPVNQNDEWHGFPIVPFSKSRYKLTNELLRRWVVDGIINEDDVPMILKKKRI